MNGSETGGKSVRLNRATVGKKGGIMNIRKSQFFTLTKKGSLGYSYASLFASSHSSFGWDKSESRKLIVKTPHEACS
jgi:hypothetical protein